MFNKMLNKRVIFVLLFACTPVSSYVGHFTCEPVTLNPETEPFLDKPLNTYETVEPPRIRQDTCENVCNCPNPGEISVPLETINRTENVTINSFDYLTYTTKKNRNEIVLVKDAKGCVCLIPGNTAQPKNTGSPSPGKPSKNIEEAERSTTVKNSTVSSAKSSSSSTFVERFQILLLCAGIIAMYQLYVQ